jgi:hypothetical protein
VEKPLEQQGLQKQALQPKLAVASYLVSSPNYWGAMVAEAAVLLVAPQRTPQHKQSHFLRQVLERNMGSSCLSSTQGAYNQEPMGKTLTNNDGSQTDSGSVSQKDLNNSQDQKFEGTAAKKSANPNIDYTGWAA